jgi:hypothetical protein
MSFAIQVQPEIFTPLIAKKGLVGLRNRKTLKCTPAAARPWECAKLVLLLLINIYVCVCVYVTVYYYYVVY